MRARGPSEPRLARRGRVARLALCAALGLVGWGAPVPVHADMRMDARALARRGAAALAEGRPDDALVDLLAAYARVPDPRVLLIVADAHEAAGRWDDAAHALERALDADPIDAPALRRRIDTLRSRAALASRAVEAAAADAAALRAIAGRAVDAARPTLASDEDLEALESAAEQTDALADATQLPRLRARASRLRGIAASARARRATLEEAASVAEGGAVASGVRASDVDAASPAARAAPRGEALRPASASPRGRAGEAEGIEAPADEPSARVALEDVYEALVVAASPAPWAREARASQGEVGVWSRAAAPASVSIVTAEDLAMAGALDGPAALRRVPGLALRVLGVGDVQLGIRGLGGRRTDRVSVTIDGRPFDDGALGTVPLGLAPVAWGDVERVEIVRGPSSALDGGLSGAVNLVLRAPGTPGGWVTAGLGDAGQVVLGAGLSASASRLRVRASGGLSTAAPFRDGLIGSGRAMPDGTALRRLEAGASISHRLDDGVALRAGVALAGGEAGVHAGLLSGPSRLGVALVSQAFAGLDAPWGLGAQITWNRREFSVSDALVEPADGAHRADDVLASVALRRRERLFGMEHRVLAGLDVRHREAASGALVDGRRAEQDGRVVLEDAVRLAPPVTLVVTASAALHPRTGPSLAPRAALVVRPVPWQSLRVVGAASTRVPSLLEAYADAPLAGGLRARGAPSLSPERLVGVEVGSTTTLDDAWTLDVVASYQVARALVSPGISADGAEAVPSNDPEAFQRVGVEASIEGQVLPGLDVRGAYTMGHAAHFAGPRGRASEALSGSTHAASAGLRYRAPFGLALAVDATWQSAEGWLDAEVDPSRGVLVETARALPAYLVLDARVTWRPAGDALELGLAGTNLVDDGHREHPLGAPVERRVMGSVSLRF